MTARIQFDGSVDAINRFCSEYRVSRRTLCRDLAVLRAAGIDISYSRERKHYDAENRNIASLDVLTPEDLEILLAVLNQAICAAVDESRRVAITRTRERIKAFVERLDPEIRDRTLRLTGTSRFDALGPPLDGTGAGKQANRAGQPGKPAPVGAGPPRQA